MAAYCLQPILPWSGAPEEDRRFRRIVTAVLTVFLLIGYVIPYLPVPKIEPAPETDVPPRLARIIADTIEPAARPPASRQLAPQMPAASSRLEGETGSVSAPGVEAAATEAAAREKAARSGILALRDSLAELRNSVPRIAAAEPGPSVATDGGGAILRRPSVLSVDVAQGSGGISGGIVAHRRILGTSAMQRRESASHRSTGERARTFPAAGEASGAERRKVRSEDEIQEILNRYKRAIYMMYNRALTKDPTLQGKVVVSITITPSGKVTECRIVYSELNAASLEKELILLIKGIDFGAKPGITVVVTRVPIEFFPV